MIWVTVLVFVGILLALVLVHEWGHFIAAKKAGCKVEEFGFGFPPRIWSIQKGETTYSFNLLPIGGFVKIEGENMEDENPGPRSFASKSASWRIVILAAGVVMNMVLAWGLLSAQAAIGMPTLVTEDNKAMLADPQTYILRVSEDSPAAAAGVQEFDRILRLGSVEQPTITDIQEVVEERTGEDVELLVNRQGEDVVTTVVPRENPPEGEGAIGISLAATGLERHPIWQAPLVGLQRTGEVTTAIVSEFSGLLRRLVAEREVDQALTGPVGIAVYTNEATEMGAPYVLEFAALISINLALINILPIPALDGGRIVFVMVEKLIGKRVPGKIEAVAHTTGFLLLIGLMLLITFKDVQRFF